MERQTEILEITNEEHMGIIFRYARHFRADRAESIVERMKELFPEYRSGAYDRDIRSLVEAGQAA